MKGNFYLFFNLLESSKVKNVVLSDTYSQFRALAFPLGSPQSEQSGCRHSAKLGEWQACHKYFGKSGELALSLFVLIFIVGSILNRCSLNSYAQKNLRFTILFHNMYSLFYHRMVTKAASAQLKDRSD